MTDFMIERVARATRTYGVRIWGAPHLYGVIKGSEWDKPIVTGLTCEFAHQEAAKLNARAVLEEMREATLSMEQAAGAATVSCPELTWKAMIDAALSETT